MLKEIGLGVAIGVAETDTFDRESYETVKRITGIARIRRLTLVGSILTGLTLIIAASGLLRATARPLMPTEPWVDIALGVFLLIGGGIGLIKNR